MIPEETYRKLASIVAPEDVEEALGDIVFRASMAAAYMLGRESAFKEANPVLEDAIIRLVARDVEANDRAAAQRRINRTRSS